MVGQGTADFEHRPDASTGGATAPNLWALFALLIDKKQKHLLSPDSVNGCIKVGQGKTMCPQRALQLPIYGPAFSV